MTRLEDGDTVEIPGSGGGTYSLTNSGGVYSCTCPGWRFQSLPLDKRTCKHLRAYLGEEARGARIRAGSRARFRSGSRRRRPEAPAGPPLHERRRRRRLVDEREARRRASLLGR